MVVENMAIAGKVVELVCSMGLTAIKDKLTDLHDARKIKADLTKFAQARFESSFKHLDWESEIDFGGLREYVQGPLLPQIQIYLFDTNLPERERCKDHILSSACTHAQAKTSQQRTVVTKFMDAALSIAQKYYVGKLDGKYKLLLNITIESINGIVSQAKCEIVREIHALPELVADAVENRIGQQPVAPTPKHGLSNFPPRPGEEFLYRDMEMAALRERIKDDKRGVLIKGIGGIGKTTIARALFHAIQGEYTHVAWVEFNETVRKSLLDSLVIFTANNTNEDERYGKIQDFLRNAPPDTLIVIDNIAYTDYQESGLKWLAGLPLTLVFTSRIDEIRGFEPFFVGFLSENQCVDIFYKYYKYDKPRQETETVRALVQLVRCHTYSVELLARAANRPGYHLAEHLALLRERGFQYPELRFSTDHTDEAQTIAQHLMTLFEMVGISDAQTYIMKNFAVMPGIDIPADVVAWLGSDVNDFDRLVHLGWLTASDSSYAMHPVIREAVRLQNPVCYEDCTRLMEYMAGNRYIQDTDVYPVVRVRLAIAEAVMQEFQVVEDVGFAKLCNQIAVVYYHQGEYSKALQWFSRSLAIHEKMLGPEHPYAANAYNAIAVVYKSQGDYPKALDWLHKALPICKKILGAEHPHTASVYNNIAEVYALQGDYPQALEWHHKALVIREKVLVPEHPDTAGTYNNIANVYYAQGNYSDSLEWHRKALIIRKNVLGLNHRDTAATHNDIANVYHCLGDYPTALKWHRIALAIREKIFGTEHPHTADTYNNIAIIYKDQGEYKEALELNQKALSIREKVLGTEHPDTAGTYNNIGNIYGYQGDYSAALEWHHKARAVYEKILGTEHPHTADTYNNIAIIYDEQADYPSALEWHQKVLETREKMLGPEHPDTAGTYNNMAIVYANKGEHSHALDYFSKAFPVFYNKLGAQHPQTVAVRGYMQATYANAGREEPFEEWIRPYEAASEPDSGEE